MKSNSIWAAFAALFFLFCFLGCSKVDHNSPEGRFGKDKYYFLALQSLQEDNESQAVRYLKKGIKHSSDFFARKSMEKLSTMGTVNERISTSANYYKKYNDQQALLRYVQELFNGKDYKKIISLTDSLPENSEAELFYFRLASVAEGNYSIFNGEIEDWFLHNPFSSFHKEFYTKYLSFLSDSISQNTLLQIQIRLSVYNGDVTKNYSHYTEAQKRFLTLFSTITDKIQWLAEQSSFLLIDIGKSLVFGGGNTLNSAELFNAAGNYALENKNEVAAFFLFFYSARLFDRVSSKYTEKAINNFYTAINCAPLPENYDNALWYYFTTSLKVSPEKAINSLKKFVATIHDPWYYADFFDTLIYRLITDRQWEYIINVYNLIKEYADPETISKYAYISGRLLQNGFISTRTISWNNAQELAKEHFAVAYAPGGNLYYRILSAYHLGIPQETFEQNIYQTKLIQDHKPNPDLEKLLDGYIAFYLPEEIFPLWQKNYSDLSLEKETQAAEFLAQQHIHKYSTQAMRITSNAIHHSDSQPTKEFFCLAYPRLFSQEMEEVCEEFKLDEYLFYALVRSESFFDPVVYSYKGAQGLTQLMPLTAGDIAKKLKLKDYDLADPKTNLRFGGSYLSDLIKRTDNFILDALSAYNAGLKRVRNWKEISPRIPQDLFLEMMPFSETREYGRKITSAAVIYAILYYDISYSQVVAEIMSY